MTSRVIRAGFLLVTGFLSSAGAAGPLERDSRYRVIAYVYGQRADICRINAAKLTHINYAFAKVSEDGEVVFEHPDAPAHLALLRTLKSKNPRLKLLLSVGGWGADHFSDAALTEASRETFAASAVAMLESHEMDGIDLDWEYPGQPGPGIKYRSEDRENFTLLLEALRRRLGDRYLLTIASSAGKYFEHTEMDKIHVDLDWINIMTYDFAGSWSKTTGHHAGLFPSTVDFVEQHLRAGIPPEKLVVGVAFFGKGWRGVKPEKRGIHQPYESYAGGYSYQTLRHLAGQDGFRRYWDRKARAPYLWSPLSATFISYDDPKSLRAKAKYVKRNRLGGIMYWEHSHDPDEILLDVLVRNLK
ncbi:MAG TPA: glycoside hydrolase family 18 protein [Thermoanaerobaculia bacterium]